MFYQIKTSKGDEIVFLEFLSGVWPGMLGAMGGAVARALVENGTNKYHQQLTRRGWWPAHWPLATFLVNLGGSFLIGLLTAVTLHWHYQYPDSWLGWMIVNVLVGFTGGFSTFSTALVDAVKPIMQASHVKTLTKLAESSDSKLCTTTITMSTATFIQDKKAIKDEAIKASSCPQHTVTVNIPGFNLPEHISFWHLFSAVTHIFLMAGLCLLAAFLGLHSIFFL